MIKSFSLIKNRKVTVIAHNTLLLIFIVAFLTGCTFDPRPQTPKERPYLIHAVLFPSKSPDVQLAGELTMPKGKGLFPAVILITGSGQQDRDETVLGHKPFLVISDYLTRMGFAVLRYDDRGVGKSSGDYATADVYDFADDALGAFEWLEKQSHIDKNKMGYLGHSEGGYIAPLASLKSPANFMILLATPAKPLLPDVMLAQSQDIARSQGQSEKIINDTRRQIIKVARILKTSKTVEEAKQSIMKLGKEEGGKTSEIKATVDLFANRWGMTYADYDPLPALQSFQKPVLALFGETDLQVSEKENAPVMKKALSNPQSQVCILAGKNHLFQNSETGNIGEYHKITTTIEPVVLENISNWLKGITEADENTHFRCRQQ